VSEAAKELGCKIVTLRHLDQYVDSDDSFGDYAPYDVGPERFLNILRGASYVCTDSFHGSVFSIIHHKQFVVFNRYAEKSKHSKNSRIDTLCGNLGLTDRRYKPLSNLCTQLQQSLDYESVDERLQKLRQSTEEYWNTAFAGITYNH